MQRRDFIKKFIGKDIKPVLVWAGIILLLVVFLNIDINQFVNGSGDLVKLLLVVAGGFVVLAFVLLTLRFLLIKILNAFPERVSAWLKKNGKTILNIIACLVGIYLLNDFLRQEKYFSIAFVLLYVTISFLFREKREMEKS